jgi:phosphoglycolate phosphatase
MGLICFNLDGTLVDPLPAMEHCVRLACEDLGLPVPGRDRLAAVVGRSQEAMFAGLPAMDDPARLDRALERYWIHFAEEGIVRHRIYDGTLLMLTRLKHQGHRLYAVTLKPARCARQVLHQFDLLLAFEDVFGGSAQAPWKTKHDVLGGMREQGVLEPGGFMVGDGPDDMAAAKANGLIPLGVTYGFGGGAELEAAGAERLFASVTALDDWFKEKLHEPETLDSFSRSE